MGIALKMYVDDNAYYPGHWDARARIGISKYTGNPVNNAIAWPGRLYGYTGSTELFFCPAKNETGRNVWPPTGRELIFRAGELIN